MKRKIALLLALLCLLSTCLCACGNSKLTATTPDETISAEDDGTYILLYREQVFSSGNTRYTCQYDKNYNYIGEEITFNNGNEAVGNITYLYDSNNHLIERTDAKYTMGGQSGKRTETYSYDEDGNCISYEEKWNNDKLLYKA